MLDGNCLLTFLMSYLSNNLFKKTNQLSNLEIIAKKSCLH